ncbi:MAG TPA: hypothetical protein VF698_06850, partial [Thermoanaerobaculia bacterium]
MTSAQLAARAARYSSPDASPFIGAEWMMTLRRLKLVAIFLPIAAVMTMELARYLVIGTVSWQQRLILDAIVVAGIVLFSTIIFRFVD